LIEWGISGEARAEIMAAVGTALTKATKSRRIKTGRELGQVVQAILAILAQHPELRASKLAGRDGRSLYSGAGTVVARAIAQVKADRESREAAARQLGELRRAQEEARSQWVAYSGTVIGRDGNPRGDGLVSRRAIK
jgi:hypothetical protein